MSQSILKIIAMLTMLIDHIGMLFFPEVAIFRFIGRIAFPIFAYLIGEGCKYSKNKQKYLLRIVLCATTFQIVRYLVDKSLMPSVAWSYAFIVALAMLVDWAKPKWQTRGFVPLAGAFVAFLVTLIGKHEFLFFPLLIGAIVYLVHKPWLKWTLLTITMVMMSIVTPIQVWALFSLPILLLYNGTRGTLKLGYAMYWFYPLHYLILGVLHYVINSIC